MPGQLDNDCYVLQTSMSPSFEPGVTRTFTDIPYNLYTPDHVFAPVRITGDMH